MMEKQSGKEEPEEDVELAADVVKECSAGHLHSV